MYIKFVDIKNFRKIEQCKLSFKPGFNLLIGENGKGKTSILEALTVALSGFISGAPDKRVHTRNLLDEDIRTVYEKQGDGAYNPKYYLPEIEISVQILDTEYTWIRSRKLKNAHTTTKPSKIRQTMGELLNNDKVLPVISYQSAARVWAQKRKKQYSLAIKGKSSREEGYIDCLDNESNVKLMVDWCARMEQISWQKDKPVREYEAVKLAVAKAMSVLEEGMVQVFYDKQTEELMYKKGQEVLPISLLSAGYQSLIWMIFDIAYRMAVLNPFLVDKVQTSPGVVLIDELDLHLHPRWQWKVIDVLRTVFPNVQFIATTHSPVIIASAKNVWCINIEDITQPISSNSGYGLEIDYILKTIQNAADIPDKIANILRQFYGAVDDMKLQQAKRSLEDLQKEIGAESPLTVKARERLELEQALAEMSK